MRSKYSMAKRVMQSVPGLRELGAEVFTRLPSPVSPSVYKIMRRAVWRDGQHREEVFRRSFRFLRDSGVTALPYLEFGVGRGTSTIMAYDLAREAGITLLGLYAFDSYAGLPAAEGNFAVGDMSYSQNQFLRFATKAGVPRRLIKMVPGYFDESLRPNTLERLGLTRGPCFVHIDCDLYASCRAVLAFITQLLAHPTVIVFDDWFCFDNEEQPSNFGEQRAFREWSERELFEELYRTDHWNISFKTRSDCS